MAKSTEQESGKNKFRDVRNRWWIWTIVVVAVLFVLLMVFGKTSILVADEDQPTTMDPAPMNNVGEDADDDTTLKEEQDYDPNQNE